MITTPRTIVCPFRTGLALLLLLGACAPEGDFEPPRPDCEGFGLQPVSLQGLKARYKGETTLITDSLQWEGYVVSTDATSNLYGEVYLQEEPTGAGGGIAFLTDLLETHAVLPFGARVTVNLQGLYLGKSGGSFELGGAFPSFGTLNVGRLPAARFQDHIKVMCGQASEPVPPEIGIESLSDSLLNTYIAMQGVEFAAEEVGSPFAEAGQETRRTLVDCRGNSIGVRNSGFSDFREEPLPEGHGKAMGILSSYRNRYELLLLHPGDLLLTEARCEARIVRRTSSEILISEVADPENLPEARFLELYNASDAPFALDGWQLRRFTNDNREPGPSFSLDGLELAAGGVLVLSAYPDVFEATYGFPPDAIPPRNGPADSNGDDSIELIDPFGTVMDAFGVPGTDGSGTAHEFEDGKAERLPSVTQSNPVFDPTEWRIYNDTGGEGTIDQPQRAPQDFSPGKH